MINRDFFTVKVKDVDRSVILKDFGTAGTLTDLGAGEYIHVGYHKPFTQMYIELEVANTIPVGVTLEYFNGSSWVSVKEAVEEINGFTKSGFIYFPRPSDWAETTIDNDTQYFVRISVSTALEATVVTKGINILLSNDVDLEAIRSSIVTKLNSGSSWVVKHEEARKAIIQKLRNSGHRTIAHAQDTLSYHGEKVIDVNNLTAFDLLEPFELREASKYLTMAFIYLDEISDEEDDKWYRNGIRHEQRAMNALELFMLKIDKNDNGQEDANEAEGKTDTVLTWV